MSIVEVRKINHEWEDELDDTSFWHYEPFSDGYWKEKYKIVLCNAEAYGDSRENCVMTFEKFKERIVKYGKDAPTLVRSALFLYCLYKKLHGITLSEGKLLELSDNYDELLEGIRNTMYMNLRKEENCESKTEDTNGIFRSFCFNFSENDKDYSIYKHNKGFTLDFIDALEADIFIITSKTGWEVLTRIYKDEIEHINNLPKWGMYKTKKTLYVSMEHPSPRAIPSINKWIKLIIDKTGKIYEELQK